MANPYPYPYLRTIETRRKSSEAHRKQWANMTEEEKKRNRAKAGRGVSKAFAKMSKERRAEINAKRSKTQMKRWRNKSKEKMTIFKRKMTKISTKMTDNRTEEEWLIFNRNLSQVVYKFWNELPEKTRRRIEKQRGITFKNRIYKNFEFIKISKEDMKKTHGVVLSDE